MRALDAIVRPSKICGTLRAPASKSDAHRAMICAALADGPTRITIEGTGRDIEATRSCLESLGAVFSDDGGLAVSGGLREARGGLAALDCGESGSTLRFILPLVPALGRSAEITGAGRLPSRPIGPLADALAARGARLSSRSLPLTVSGELSPGDFRLPGDVSSQFITGLLFALPLLDGTSTITMTTPLESAGYVEMTIRTLERFGVEVERTADGWRVPSSRYRSPGGYAVEGDWSSAAFPLAAGAIAGGRVTVIGLARDTAQGDAAICSLLARFGARAERDETSASVEAGEMRGIEIDASQIPDMVPALAAVAAYAKGRTTIYGASRLRIKESDRIASTCEMLRAIGVSADETDDGLTIEGGSRPSGGTVDCAGDHRIAMASAAAACGCTAPVRLVGAHVCEKSYPRFFSDLRSIGGDADVEHHR